jgi:GAF domain-containing protein
MGATDDWTREIEELHRTLGEGPALTAQQTGKPVIVAALEKESGRWPAWVAAATALGVTGMWSYPLIVGGARVGAITFHRTDQRQQGPSEISDARILVDLAGRLLWADADRIERGDADDDLQDYQTVNMAAGMVSVQLDISIPDAVTRIRAHAFVNDQSITMVAGDIVERRLRLR